MHSYKFISFLALFFCLTLVDISLAQLSGTSVWTRGYNNARTGANLSEKTLNTHNVNVQQFGKLFSRKVVGHIYAQILYVPNVYISSTSKNHNTIFVTTQSNNIYAFDADDVNNNNPLWQVNLGTPYYTSDNDVGTNCGFFQDIAIEVGITSTPVIDTGSNTIYVVALTKENGEFKHRLHALSLSDGSEKPNSPVVVQATIAGNGDGSYGGRLSFLSKTSLQRLSLALINGVVYFGFGGYCFTPPYHGWLFGYDSQTLQQKLVYCSTPNGRGGGIWQGGSAITSDGAYLYFVSTNGDFDGVTNFGDTFAKMNPSNAKIVSSFTPYNQYSMFQADLDAGTTGITLIPNSDLLLGCSKVGRCYLMNKSNMGGYNPNVNNIVQDFNPSPEVGERFGAGVHTTPVAWESASKGTLVYLWRAAGKLQALHLIRSGSLGQFDLGQTETSNIATAEFPGGMLSLSADGSSQGSGIIWACHSTTGSANHIIQQGVLRAVNAEDISHELWNSDQNKTRDSVGYFAKFNPPMVINGRVYVATFGQGRESYVHAFGILNPPVQQSSVQVSFPQNTSQHNSARPPAPSPAPSPSVQPEPSPSHAPSPTPSPTPPIHTPTPTSTSSPPPSPPEADPGVNRPSTTLTSSSECYVHSYSLWVLLCLVGVMVVLL